MINNGHGILFPALRELCCDGETERPAPMRTALPEHLRWRPSSGPQCARSRLMKTGSNSSASIVTASSRLPFERSARRRNRSLCRETRSQRKRRLRYGEPARPNRQGLVVARVMPTRGPQMTSRSGRAAPRRNGFSNRDAPSWVRSIAKA